VILFSVAIHGKTNFGRYGTSLVKTILSLIEINRKPCYTNLMKRNISCKIITGISILLCFISCTKNDNPEIVKTAEAVYQNSEGKKMEVVFYSLSDNSLNFVRVTYDGELYTLPQLVSASGARYSDEFSMEFWVKGNTASVTTGFDGDEKRDEFFVQ